MSKSPVRQSTLDALAARYLSAVLIPDGRFLYALDQVDPELGSGAMREEARALIDAENAADERLLPFAERQQLRTRLRAAISSEADELLSELEDQEGRAADNESAVLFRMGMALGRALGPHAPALQAPRVRTVSLPAAPRKSTRASSARRSTKAATSTARRG